MSNTIKKAMEKAGIKGSKGNGPKIKAPAPGVSQVKRGTVKWFDLHKGYGFVTGEDGVDVFVHFNKIVLGRQYLGFEPGDPVTFRTNVDNNSGRLQAVNVSLEIDDSKTADAVEDGEA